MNQDEKTGSKRKRSETSSVAAQKKPRLTSDLHIVSAEDSRVIQSVEAKYDILVHSVISSSKMQRKVTSVLRHLRSQSSTGSTKPPISVLRARAPDAGKLVSIAEIVKRQISKEADGSGQWFEYIALGEEIKETSREEGKTIIEDTIQSGRDRTAGEEEEEEDEGKSEFMKTPFERAIDGRPKLRTIPVMNLFLSRTSIDALKKQYGEQTNMKTQKESR